MVLMLANTAFTSEQSKNANVAAATSEAVARSERVDVMVQKLKSNVDKLNERLAKDPDDLNPRELTNAALLVLQTKGPVSTAALQLRRMFKRQNMDPASRDYGTLPWKFNDPTAKDANSIEFAMQPMGPILLGYGDRFSDGFKKDIRANIEAAIVALNHHRVKVEYTNIFLMNTVNKILLGQYVGDPAAVKRGHQQMQEWMNYTAQNGIAEFASPTYYGVSMANLTFGYIYTADPQVKRQFKEALDLFWRDISANYLAKAERISGAHSRDYSLLMGSGAIDQFLYLEGMQGKDLVLLLPGTDTVNPLENERPSGYRPSAEIRALSMLPERFVEHRWESNAATARYTYLTQDFAIGTASGTLGAQDKLFVADLTGPRPLPSIILLPDMFDSPYGVLKARDRGGHMKVNHLPEHMSAVQDNGLALMVLDLDPKDALSDDKVKGNSFSTNLVLPAQADEIIVDGKPVKVSKSLNQAAQANSVVGVRAGTSCFAARFYQVDALDGKAPTFVLKADQAGLDNGAVRLVAYHSQKGLTTTTADHLRVGVIAMAASCSDSAGLTDAMKKLRDANIQTAESDGVFKVSAKVANTSVELTEDTKTRLPIQKKVNGTDYVSPLFMVNGESMPLQSASAQGARTVETKAAPAK